MALEAESYLPPYQQLENYSSGAVVCPLGVCRSPTDEYLPVKRKTRLLKSFPVVFV